MEIRDVFFGELYRMLEGGEDLVVVTADLVGGQYLNRIKSDFPDSFLSVGIAEQNLIMVAAGLAMQGKKAVCWGMNPFIVSRTLDQIDNTISLMHLPVTIVGFHAGLSFAATGPSHAGTRDISRIRTCDYMKCINPMDYNSVREAVNCSMRQEQGLYIRLDKDITWETVAPDSTVEMGKGVQVVHRGSSPLAVVTSGLHVKMVLDLLEDLKSQNVDPTIVAILTFPFDEAALIKCLDRCETVITVEEMILQGGMSSSVLESFAAHGVLKNVHRMGIDTRDGHPSFYGKRADLQEYLRLDKEHILETVLKLARADS